ncbi:MAG: S8 family serine peptidase [Phycisphaerales bacterium]|nr:MAG: S8 family serine peptidase [Phycisphaerales bacterium]
MTTSRTFFFAAVAVVLAAVSAAPAGQVEKVTPFTGPVDQMDVMGGYASTHVIVRVREGVNLGRTISGAHTLAADGQPDPQLAAMLTRWQAQSIAPTGKVRPQNEMLARKFGLDRYYTIRVPQGTDTRALAAELSAFDHLIEIAEVSGIGGIIQTFPSDTYFNYQYGLHNTGQYINGQTGIADSDIDAPEAWDLHTGTDAMILAMIDTGVSTSHPDLNDKLIPGWNIIDNNSNTEDSWLISHGTHCSGIASAESNNNQGVCGVSWGAKIMPIKVVDALGMGTEEDCADGVIWAADHGAHVGSMSLGYPVGIQYFENAINYAHAQGMVLVAASGNNGAPPVLPPARFENTIAVGATDNRDNLAGFSSYGPEMSVVAPGVSVYSCIDDLLYGYNTYTYMDGTSMACPHVSGLALLIWSANLDLNNDEVRDIIESTADDLGPAGWDQQFGYGRINAYAAVDAAINAGGVYGDVNGDGVVNIDDVFAVLAAWGPCDGCPEDVNGDGVVNIDDLFEVLANWS